MSTPPRKKKKKNKKTKQIILCKWQVKAVKFPFAEECILSQKALK